MTCSTWTVNRTSHLRRAISMGVDGNITNHPAVLVRLLDGSEWSRAQSVL
jgi:glycerophosphoryl diester phosphodiesterase